VDHNDSAIALPGPLALSLDPHGRPLLSPSAAQLWQRCNRAFGWRYLEGLREPPKPSQRLGTAYHSAMESYLLGRLRSADELVRATLPELDDEQWRTLRRIVKAVLSSGVYPEPRPGVVVAVEQALSFVGANASWRGYADALLRPSGVLEVHDHKTTRSLDYGLTDESLPSDPQAVFYVAAVSHPRDGATPIALQWTYVQTHGAALVRAARCTMTATEAHERMTALDAAVGGAVVELVRTRPRVLDLRPEWSACDAFGGCPHRERCGERPILAALSAALDHPRAPGADRTGDTLSQVTMQTFAERYGAAPTNPAATAPPQPTPAATAASAQPAPDPLAAIFAQQSWTPQPQSPPPAASVPAAPVQEQAPPAPAPQSPPPGPYDAANRPGGPATAYPDLRAAAGGPVAQSTSQTPPTIASASMPQSYGSPQTAPQAPQPAPSSAQAAPQHIPAAPPPVPQHVQPTQPAQSQAPTSHPAATGFALVVGHIQGASPFRRTIPFEAVVRRAADVLRERHGVPDFRLAEYGRGPGMLALAIQGALLEVQAGPGDAIVVGHVGPEWQAVAAGLMAQAAFTISGAGW
jgi:hypothetical protein